MDLDSNLATKEEMFQPFVEAFFKPFLLDDVTLQELYDLQDGLHIDWQDFWQRFLVYSYGSLPINSSNEKFDWIRQFKRWLLIEAKDAVRDYTPMKFSQKFIDNVYFNDGNIITDINHVKEMNVSLMPMYELTVLIKLLLVCNYDKAQIKEALSSSPIIGEALKEF